eukprot:gene5412-3899_t
MKVTLKTVTGKPQQLDVDESATIRDIKELLKEEYDIPSLRLCFNGEVIADTITVASLGMTEKDSFVIAGKKSKVASKVAAQQNEALNAKASAKAETQVEAPAPAPGAGPGPAAAPGPVPVVEPRHMAPAAVNSDLVDSVVAMGFEDRTRVALALKAAYMNVDRAVEYLCTGIPESALQDTVLPETVGGGNAPLEVNTSQLRAALAAVPQFNEIKATYQQNKEVLPVILEQMAQRFPELYTMVVSNIEEFQSIMDEPTGAPGFSSASEATNHLADNMPREITITEEDRNAIVQLVELGGGTWDHQAAMMVYLACAKNQEAAASLLFDCSLKFWPAKVKAKARTPSSATPNSSAPSFRGSSVKRCLQWVSNLPIPIDIHRFCFRLPTALAHDSKASPPLVCVLFCTDSILQKRPSSLIFILLASPTSLASHFVCLCATQVLLTT